MRLQCATARNVLGSPAEKLVARGQIQRHDRVIVISTANGLKFTDFKTGYHDGTLPGVTAESANRPLELAAEFAPVRDAVFHASELTAAR